MYHEVLEENINYDAWTVVKKCEFRRQMEYLKNNYLVISMNDASDIMNRKGKECEHYALVTFDDGYSGNYNVVMPIMTELGLPFTVFCSTNYIERGDLYWWDKVIYSALNCRTKISLTEFFLGVYDFRKSQTAEQRWVEIQRLLTDLKQAGKETRENIVSVIMMKNGNSSKACPMRPLTIEQVKELANNELVTIGSHSHTHDILTELSLDEAYGNILRSRNHLIKWSGQRVNYFSYPNGDYSTELMKAVKNAGFLCAVTTENRKWKSTDSVFAIPRIGIGRFDSINKFKATLTGVQ